LSVSPSGNSFLLVFYPELQVISLYLCFSFLFSTTFAGNLISILVFASPIKTFWWVVKKKSTENYKGVPYITTLLSTSLWTFYGIINPDGLLVMTVNGAGAIFQLIYVTLFLIYAPKDKKIKTAKLVAVLDVGFLGAVIAVTLLAIHGRMRLTFVGILCAGLTIGMYASPLSAMRTVIRTKSVEYMPFLLSFFLFLNAGVWSAYAMLVKDIYIGVPNAVGFVLGSAQLILYVIYKNKSASAKSPEAMEEEGSAHLVKRGIEMHSLEDDLKNRSLNKGRSLPKPHVSRQYSLQKIMKTISLTPYESQSSYPLHSDVEDGNTDTGHP
ncbi:bidirectional sugar transporter SWEET17-like, partial [Herrania umbratica]|uniref:Bidirectional sugar transporter SWEET n=1 Tax=Herrania umbratica TaxID=108875 RepID=A0A6J1A8F8_9ROSI